MLFLPAFRETDLPLRFFASLWDDALVILPSRRVLLLYIYCCACGSKKCVAGRLCFRLAFLHRTEVASTIPKYAGPPLL